MRRVLPLAPATAGLFTLTMLATLAGSARADDVPTDFPRLVLDDGRIPLTPAEPGVIRFEIHGEEQIRFEGLRSFPLEPSPAAAQAAAHPPSGTAGSAAKPATLISDSIGQNYFLSHWLRLTPTLQITNKLSIIGQADLTGLLAGQTAHDTWPDQTPRDSLNGYDNVQPRWLYLEWLTPVGLLRAGQQGAHWGMGLVANDGDHPSLFGDYRYGNIVEQVLFATKPLGEKSPFVVALAGNLVYRDNFAILTNGQQAWQGVLAAFYEDGPDMLGLYGVYRAQNQTASTVANSSFDEYLNVGVVDVAGRFARPISLPDERAYVFGAFEAAYEYGSTNIEQNVNALNMDIRAYGGAASMGVVLADKEATATAPLHKGDRPDLWGRFVGQIEAGYASGDANPFDGTEKRFLFDGNHKVGLLLFDEIMRWETARSAMSAQDPNLLGRPSAGATLLPSNGGVFGAQYLYPTAVYRPRPWLDLKAGAVVAQTTADLVDPYRTVKTGSFLNYQGGAPQHHDLGVELDGGFETRIDVGESKRLRFQLGAQAGVLFPGGALDDATGATLKTPWVAIGRLGLQL
jgi:hypothetical protein